MERHWTCRIPFVLMCLSFASIAGGIILVFSKGEKFLGFSQEWLLSSGFVLLLATAYLGNAVKATCWFECLGGEKTCVLMLQSLCAQRLEVIVDAWFNERVNTSILSAQESRLPEKFTMNPNLTVILRPFTEGKIKFTAMYSRTMGADELLIDKSLGRGIKVISGYGMAKVREVGP